MASEVAWQNIFLLDNGHYETPAAKMLHRPAVLLSKRHLRWLVVLRMEAAAMSTEYKRSYTCEDCAWGRDTEIDGSTDLRIHGHLCSFLVMTDSLRERGLEFYAPAFISHCPEWRPQR